MAPSFVWKLQNIWPFSTRKFDDLRVSNELVRKLSVPEYSKQFVFAIREPETQSVVYILSAQCLSEQSALNAESLIREVKPDAVVAQIGNFPLSEVQSEESELVHGVDDPVPVSSFGVLKRCFIDKINKEKYENVAGNFVLREIFGTSFHGHFLAAKRAAEEVGSSFLALESPFVKFLAADDNLIEREVEKNFQGLVSSLLPNKVGSSISSNSKRFFLNDEFQSQMVKLLSANMDLSMMRVNPHRSAADVSSMEVQPCDSYEPPSFAKTIHALLLDLHNIFVDLPSIGSALGHAQKMLSDVNKGKAVDTRIIYEVYTFKLAIEALRIAFNNSGRLSMTKLRNNNTDKVEFSELPVEEKSQVLFAQAIRSQTKKFKTIVAIVDASSLAGLRKHWNTVLPVEIKDFVEQMVTDCDEDAVFSGHSDKKRMLTDKPVIAVGAGATALVGASSLSKVPASTLMKVAILKAPTSLKLFLIQSQKAFTIAFSKAAAPAKVVAPGFTTYSAKTTSVLKAVSSTNKIRAVIHGAIASAEKTSLSTMKTAFYEIMRKRQVRPVGLLPWATFGCSVATCSGLLIYGDGIECAAESLPSAPSIASLGRGIQNLRNTSQAVRQGDGWKIQNSVESLLGRLKNLKVQ